MKNKLIFLPVIFFSLIFATCKKQPDTSNDFYFHCKINGEMYIPGLGNDLTCELLGDTTFLLGGNIGFRTLAMGIIKLDRHPIITSIYILNNNLQQKAYYKNSTILNDKYETDSSHPGELHINTLDKTNKIIQGTFFFKAYNAFRNDSVSVTDGTFRLHYIIS
jgi:hypothetical protein